MADQIISRLLLGLDTREFRNGIRQADKELKDWSKGVGKIGEMLGAAFAVGIIADFTMEAVKLGDQLNAAARGFERFGNAADLDRLRKSTQGMVSDVKLLQQAVQAGNFGIPVKELGTLFEFAQKRAKETGQEVDYLTNSIVTGIGRKSPLILDNLGISASMLRDKLHGVTVESATIGAVTKAVGEIASEQLKLMGDTVQDATTSSQQLVTTWENFKASSGQTFSPIINKVLQLGSAILTLTSDMLGLKGATNQVGEDKFWGFGTFLELPVYRLSEATKKATSELLNMGATMRGIWNTFNTVGYTTLAGMKSRLAELQTEFENADVSGVRIKKLRIEIEKLKAAIDKVTGASKGSTVFAPDTSGIKTATDAYFDSLRADLFKATGMWYDVEQAQIDALDPSILEDAMTLHGDFVDDVIPGIVTVSKRYKDLGSAINQVSGAMSDLVNIGFAAFKEAAETDQKFFDVFKQKLIEMRNRLLAAAAAALALAVALQATGLGGGAKVGQLFQVIGGQMGIPGLGGSTFNPVTGMVENGLFGGRTTFNAATGMVENGLFGGRTTLRGNDIYLANSRSGYDLGRIG
jgi:hypothetical protein